MTEPSGSDPLINEIRTLRRELSERFDNDVKRLCDYLRTIENQNRDRITHPLRSSPGSKKTD